MKRALLLLPALLLGTAAFAQGLDPVLLTKPAIDAWPTSSGDYSGRRFSTLTQINQSNIKNLGLAWTSRLAPGRGHLPPHSTGPVLETEPPSSAGKSMNPSRYAARDISQAGSCR